jgi:hypothetical protein
VLEGNRNNNQKTSINASKQGDIMRWKENLAKFLEELTGLVEDLRELIQEEMEKK